LDTFENMPLDSTNIIPQQLVGLSGGKRRYIKSKLLAELALTKYKENRKGIRFTDLVKVGLAKNKRQAQLILKHALNAGTLFTLDPRRPQQYYPTSLKSEITKNYLSRNIPIQPSGVSLPIEGYNGSSESLVIQSLENYVLPLLPTSPIFVHNLHLKFKLTSDCYDEISIAPNNNNNQSKRHEEIIGQTHVCYLFYPSGRVIVSIQCSNNPLKLETEIDRSRILTFFGQVRDRLILYIADRHERFVPDILRWELTQCDINKDIVIPDLLHFTGLKIQVSHLDHLFRIYIKSMGVNTGCRIEENANLKKPAIEAINKIFNPNEVTDNLLLN
jgi:hypothetical protein